VASRAFTALVEAEKPEQRGGKREMEEDWS
jgi:hypothetical protein